MRYESISPLPPGDSWEFFFQFRDEKLYGKLLLKKSDGKSVIIFSAHRPEKPNLRCEKPSR